MIKHRHTRGMVLDLNSEVCPNSYLKNSKVGTETDIYCSYLEDSWVEYSNLVMTSVVRGDISTSKIYEGSVFESTLKGVTSRGGIFFNCNIDADVVVGNAVLNGLTITEDMRIGVGNWTRVPRRFEINDSVATGVIVTESTDGCAYIGCQRKPMRIWIKGAKRFQKVIGWDDESIDLVCTTFEDWLK